MIDDPTPKDLHTNFTDDLDSQCEHCGELQSMHRELRSLPDGSTYDWRIPCKPELESFGRERRKLVRTANWIVTLWSGVIEVINLIPGVSLTVYLWGCLKRHLGHKFKK